MVPMEVMRRQNGWDCFFISKSAFVNLLEVRPMYIDLLH